MVICATCNRTAPSNPPCPRGMCGRCCPKTPPCDPSNHLKPRRKVRGVVGKGSKSRKESAWKEAHARCRHLWRTDRIKVLSRVLGVTPQAMHKATMASILREVRAQLGHTPPSDEAATQAAETAEDMSVALLVSPQAEAQAVRNVLDSTTLREYLAEEDAVDETEEPWQPDWGIPDDMEPDDDDTVPADAPSSSSLVPTGADSAATVSTIAWLGGDEAPAALAPSTASASASTSVWLGGPDRPLAATSQSTKKSSSNVTQPWIVKNAEGLPCAHWNRMHPPYANSLQTFDSGGYCYDKQTPFQINRFFQFFEQHKCGGNLRDVREAQFPWTAAGTAAELVQEMHAPGRWFRFQLREPHPCALDGTDRSSPLVWKHPTGGYIRCMHCTCLYNVPKLLRNGLVPGPYPGKGGVIGVYCYPMEGAALATRSSGYCMYTSPFEDGWFWGARCEMQVAKGLSVKRKIAVGNAQLAPWIGSYSMVALWIHVMHEQELRTAYDKPVTLYYLVDKWNPDLVEQ